MSNDSTGVYAPGGISGFLIRRVGAAAGAARDPRIRTRLGLLQGWVSVVINIGIFLLKLLLGLTLGSIALIADSFDSLFDVVGSSIVIAGFKLSQKPRDKEHPFGHGRIDMVGGLILAVILIVVGVELLRASFSRVLHPSDYVAPWWIIIVVALTIPLKEWLAVFSRGVSRATQSHTLEADYWFHRFDSITSAIVCFGLLLSRFGLSGVDGWIGLVIAGVIAWTGVNLVKEAVGPLLGEAPTREEVQAVLKTATSVSGVNDAHDVIIHKYGDVKLVSFHIEVDADRSALDIHDLSEHVESEVEKATGCRAIVHVDPVDRSHPMYAEVAKAVEAIAKEDDSITAYHDVRVWGQREDMGASVDIVVELDVAEGEYGRIEQDVAQKLRDADLGLAEVRVAVEAAFTGRGEL